MKRRVLILMVLAAGGLACARTATPSPGQPAAPVETGLPAATPTSTAAMTAVWVYYTMAADENMTPVPVERSVPESANEAVLLHSTLKELVKGPTGAEQAAGMTSWFSAETAGTVVAVSAGDGEFTVDVAGWPALIPNASTSAGSRMLLSQMNSTVFQFGFVQKVQYTLNGDCAAFWEWLQMDCHPVTRAEWEAG
ncbi:MAG: GerMN domain-containing protein [Anaerolineales bacterium]|nr:GerMN domain-containing protein [Anaerolineales bacterium]